MRLHNASEHLDRQIAANIVDPDQTASVSSLSKCYCEQSDRGLHRVLLPEAV